MLTEGIDRFDYMNHVRIAHPRMAGNGEALRCVPFGNTQAVRAVYFIDPKARIRALIYYPLSNGRNFDEIKRLLVAMQTSDEHRVATPADWRPGDEVIIPPPGSVDGAADRLAGAGEDYHCLDWFLCLKKLDL